MIRYLIKLASKVDLNQMILNDNQWPFLSVGRL